MTLAELIASGRATVKLEEIVRTRADDDAVLDLSRCSAYEAAANGELPFVFRVGRRYLCSVPGILRMLQIPLPEGWRPASACAERCRCSDSEPVVGGSIISNHESAVDGRADAAPLTHLERATRGNGQHARARCDGRLRSRDGTAPDE